MRCTSRHSEASCDCFVAAKHKEQLTSSCPVSQCPAGNCNCCVPMTIWNIKNNALCLTTETISANTNWKKDGTKIVTHRQWRLQTCMQADSKAVDAVPASKTSANTSSRNVTSSNGGIIFCDCLYCPPKSTFGLTAAGIVELRTFLQHFCCID
jgi:hypothetical protein